MTSALGIHRLKTYNDLQLRFPDRTRWALPYALRYWAERSGERVYLRVPAEGLALSFSDMAERAERIAAGLISRHGQVGDRLLIMAENSSAFIEAWFGAALAGLIEVPINTAYEDAFLEHQVSLVAPRLAVIDAIFAERFVKSRHACQSIEEFFVIDDNDGVGTKRLQEAGYKVEPFDALRIHERAATYPETDPRSLGAIFFTSGTTGLSKGVMMTHSALHFFAEEGASLTRLDSDDVYMSVGPLFHANAQLLAAYPALLAGAQFVLQKRFSASNWVRQVRDSGATVTNFVGVMMSFVWQQPETALDSDNSLRCVLAAPTASSILDAFKRRFDVEAVVECFGLTEVSLPIMTPYGVDRPPGAAGLVVNEWFEVKLVNPDTDEEVPIGEVGELVVRPKVPFTICSGYFNMPEKTVEAQRNLWFHTGDGLRRDEEGWFYFVDRLKDAIRRRGENISSFEIEQSIAAHPDIEECAVIGVRADTEAGEDEVLLFVVRRAGTNLEPDAVWEWCDERLPRFAIPRYLRFIDSLPRTPSDKLQKAKLREIGIDDQTLDRESPRLDERPV